jgi:phage terminase large subunit
MVDYQIIEVNDQSDIKAYQPYGAALALWKCKDHECVVSGPAETGKTRAALEKIDGLAWKYAGAQLSIIRKTYKSMPGSVLQTYEKKVIGAWNEQENRFDSTLTPIHKYGGEKPEWYDYPNGSRIWVGGMDNPAKVLSSERDFVYINQVEELTLDEWETILTRVTGRAGNAPYTQVLGDANPGPRNHWILERAAEGKMTLLHSRHEDNPTLFDQDTGEVTAQGKITLSILDSLTGVRYQRLRLGKWVSAEGQIYNGYDPAIHLIPRFEIPVEWRRFRVIDFGLTHPFVCLWIALDEDQRMYVYRYIYMTGRTVATHAQQIKQLSKGEAIEQTVCDHDAEDRLTLEENGIPNIQAKKDVLQGIGKVQDRLKKQADDKPRLFILQDSLVEVDQSLKQFKQPYTLEEEFDLYIWKNNAKKEEPVKENDHGLDTLRYGVMYLDGPEDTQWKKIKFLHL